MNDKVIDFGRARQEKQLEIKEKKLKKMRNRFSAAFADAEKPKTTKKTTQEKMRLSAASPWDEE